MSIRRSYCCVWVLATLMASAAGCVPDRAAIVGSDFRRHVAYLADDRLGGRGVGSEGIDLAAEYIAEQFERAGLQPAGVNNTFFQPFEVTLGPKRTGEARLTVSGVGSAKPDEEFVPLPFSTGETFEGPLAFAGFGIRNEEAYYDDYANFDPAGKVLLMFRYEPYDPDPKAKFGGKTPSEHALFPTKAKLARKLGAKAILLVNPPLHRAEQDVLYDFDSLGAADHVSSFGIPMLHVTRAYAERVLRAAGAPDLKTLQEELERRKPRSFDLEGLTAAGHPGVTRPKVTTRNVIGVARGRGPMADEYVVIGAHYDHLGVAVPRRPMSSGPAGQREPQIHNGADDNASGTAGLIELAEAFGGRDDLQRSILFIAFSGEEMGLLGSDHFVDHPTVPLDRVVAMLNMDMIGRLRDNRLQIYGVETAAEFAELVRQQSEGMGFEIKASGGGFGPSDHTSFYKRNIPVLHFFTGIHSDYHMPGDDTPAVNASGGARVTRLVYRIADALASAPGRPTYVAAREEERHSQMKLRVRMGVMPSYAEDEADGMLIEGVSPGSPAEKAGLKEGDRILMIGEDQVDDVYDLMEVLGKREPGDQAEVTLQRDGKQVRLPITFEAP